MPYYYAGDSYYVWDGTDGRYEAIQPPPQVSQQAANAAPMKLYAYPKNGQSAEQQAADTAECVRWAHQQVDSTSAVPPNPGAPPFAAAATRPGVLSTAPPATDSTAVGAIAAATAAGTGAQGAASGAVAGGQGMGLGPGSRFARAEAACLTGKGYSVD